MKTNKIFWPPRAFYFSARECRRFNPNQHAKHEFRDWTLSSPPAADSLFISETQWQTTQRLESGQITKSLQNQSWREEKFVDVLLIWKKTASETNFRIRFSLRQRKSCDKCAHRHDHDRHREQHEISFQKSLFRAFQAHFHVAATSSELLVHQDFIVRQWQLLSVVRNVHTAVRWVDLESDNSS